MRDKPSSNSALDVSVVFFVLFSNMSAWGGVNMGGSYLVVYLRVWVSVSMVVASHVIVMWIGTGTRSCMVSHFTSYFTPGIIRERDIRWIWAG